jgi:SHS2 domain-containing protein
MRGQPPWAETVHQVDVSAPTQPECLAEAVRALVAFCASATAAAGHPDRGTSEVTIVMPEADEADLLAGLLEQVLQRILGVGSVPVDVEVTEPQKGGLDVRLVVAPLQIPAARHPTRVCVSEPSLRPEFGRWRATFVVTV